MFFLVKVLLTGTTGFIGKHLLTALIRQGHEVIALIRPGQNGANSRLKLLLDDIGMIDGAISALAGDLSMPRLGMSLSDYERALEVDVIIHAGATMDLKMEATAATTGILDGVDHMLEFAKAVHRRRGLTRFVHLVGYMSPINDGISFELNPNTKEFLPDASPYEQAKAIADLRVRHSANQEGYSLTVINPCTVVGPHDTGVTEQLSGLGILVDALRRGLLPVIPGGEKYWLPLVNVDHLATFVASIVAWQEAAGKTYVILDPGSPRQPELLAIAARELAIAAPKITLPLAAVRTFLRFGGAALTGIPTSSLDFLTDRSFSTVTTIAAREALGLSGPNVRDSLPFVIADLDYRLGKRGGMTTNFLTKRVGDLATLVRHGGTKTPWVILHGIYSSAEMMVPLAQHLQGESVWIPDLPGFGRSPLNNGEFPLDEAVAAVVRAIEEISVPVRLVGHSFGAAVAVEVARLLPTLVESLHLLQPPLRQPNLSWSMRVQGRWSGIANWILRFRQPRWLLEYEAVKTGGFDKKAEIPQGYIDAVQADMASPRIRRSTLAVLKWLVSTDKKMDLGIEGLPVQLLWGEHDPAYPVVWAEEVATPYKNIILTRLSHGHQFPISHPEETARALYNAVFR